MPANSAPKLGLWPSFQHSWTCAKWGAGVLSWDWAHSVHFCIFQPKWGKTALGIYPHRQPWSLHTTLGLWPSLGHAWGCAKWGSHLVPWRWAHRGSPTHLHPAREPKQYPKLILTPFLGLCTPNSVYGPHLSIHGALQIRVAIWICGGGLMGGRLLPPPRIEVYQQPKFTPTPNLGFCTPHSGCGLTLGMHEAVQSGVAIWCPGGGLTGGHPPTSTQHVSPNSTQNSFPPPPLASAHQTRAMALIWAFMGLCKVRWPSGSVGVSS